MNEKFMRIDPNILERVQDCAWSIENMEAHGADGRSVMYIGSVVNGYLDGDGRNGKLLYDYYIDALEECWYGNRALLPDGRIVSMEMYIFGKEIRKIQTRRRKK